VPLGTFIKSVVADSLYPAVPPQKIPQFIWIKIIQETMSEISSVCMSIGDMDTSISINFAVAEAGGMKE
jgi:hypothetical protein